MWDVLDRIISTQLFMNGNRRPQIRTPWPSATSMEKWGFPHYASDGDIWKEENDNSLRLIHYWFHLHPLVRRLYDLFSLMLVFLDKHSFLFYLRTTPTFTELQNTKFLDVLLRAGNGTPFQYSCLENPMDGGAWSAAVHGVAKSRTGLSDFTFHFHVLEKEMATHSSVLAWRIPGMGEPGGLPSMGSHRVGHNWSDLAAAADILLDKTAKATNYHSC